MNEKILLVDDEPAILNILKKTLLVEGFQVSMASRGQDAIQLCQATNFELMITDIKMPGMDGLELLRRIKALDPTIEVLILTGFASLDNAIQALKTGRAFDFLKKPLENIDSFLHTIHQALEKRRLSLHNQQLLEAVVQHRDHLEELVEQRTIALQHEIQERKRTERELKKAKKAAETANLVKSEFIATMSHEIRTPLNVISGFAQLLQADPGLTFKQREYIHTILEGSGALLTLLSDILTIAKMQSGRLELLLDSFCLKEAFETIVTTTSLQVRQKGLSFTYEIDPSLPSQVYGDEKRLRQVLFNLLGNAVKFTSEGMISFRAQQVRPSTTSSQTACGTHHTPIRFEVEDSGIGIPPGAIEKILLPFKQLDKEKRCTEGVGLGLAISQRLLQMMGSELQVKSRLGEGSIFFFDLYLPPI